ncbi:IS3 family transposase [Thermotalea metallivorans]|uniref:Integrase catalytic domain-containing protein n=1 Tax=Thermotalea metallivorans TaxID=520762 RepID=A0A140L397_9FIRM|nr:IS3 family transposase [Thermotalea metallivorans]KXG75022.1 hypothetical protein AN619_19920 [Thermotalea metallivorans]
MKRRHFTPEEKSKIVLELLRVEKTSSEIAQAYQIHPNMLSRWKSEFLANMHTVFAKENSSTEKRYMGEMGIYVIYPGPNLSKRNKAHKVYPYLLRNLPITRANQVWGVDITYVSMPKGWMYLFVIIDWYSRCIIDHELSNTMETGFMIEILQRAFKKAIPEIMNSDQGSQFTSNEYIDLLKENHVRIRMDSKGRATDNAITEGFFRNIKQEKLYIFEYSTPRKLRSLINEYIHFYNFNPWIMSIRISSIRLLRIQKNIL